MSSTLGTPRFEEEIRSYLENRLLVLTRVLSILFTVLGAAFMFSMASAEQRSLVDAAVEFATTFPNAIAFLLMIATIVLHGVLATRRISSTGLAVLDGVLLMVLIMPCLLLFERLHQFAFSGFAFVVPFLVLFILARAVLVPSTAFRTFLLSFSAPLGVLAIQLRAGGSFAYAGEPYPHSHFIDTLVQNQVCLWGATAIAMVASRVNLSLRRKSYDARHAGQYYLQEKIGSGAMGEVYLATHSLLKRKTAIKFLRPEIAGKAALERFEREVKLAASLSHPNTIAIYDYGYTAEGIFYYAMELVEGATLREIVERTGPMPSERVIHVILQVAAALQEAHEAGIVHRDVKPANIMLCERGGVPDFVKILDFGVAKKIERARGALPVDGTVAGSLETLAPEALRGEAVGPASDLYSLGVVVYYLASGKPLFEAESGTELIRHHLLTVPVPPSEHEPSVDKELERVILRALSKDPSERPGDAAAFRDALRACRVSGRWTDERAREWWAVFEASPRPGKSYFEIGASTAETRIRDLSTRGEEMVDPRKARVEDRTSG